MATRLVTLLLALTLGLAACVQGSAVAPRFIDSTAEHGRSNESRLVLTSSIDSTELLDVATGDITSLGDIVTGDRAVLLWYWAPDCVTCFAHAGEIQAFAEANADRVQVIGVGSQEDFVAARDFRVSAGLDSLPLLWEASGKLWRINNVGTNSAMQLLTHDLADTSSVLFFNDAGRQTVVDASRQQPWAP